MAYFFLFYRTLQTSGNNLKEHTSFTASFLQAIWSVFKNLRGCWKHKFLKRKAIFPVKRLHWPVLSRFIEHDNLQGTISMSIQVIHDKYCAIFIIVSTGPQKTRTKVFKKKGNLPGEKKRFWPFFSRIIEYYKPQKTKYKDRQSILTTIWK